ncbi:MAG: response regulator [Betaproteobacteria bacterium]|nr:response regulator [Betaproteobacteria bacterium]
MAQRSSSPSRAPAPAEAAPEQPTVFIVDDETVVADSLRWLIEPVGLKVETFASAAQFLASYRAGRPGCLVLDVRMPAMSGLTLQEELIARGIALPIIFITGHGGVQTAVRALQKGAIDFVEKPFDDQRMLDLVQRAIALDVERRREVAAHADAAARYASLSAREREVLDQLIEGRTNKEIARVLGLSAKTVETYRANVMAKMAAATLPHLVKAVLDMRRAAPGRA